MKDSYVSPGPSGNPGMELRDFFAGLAMQGLISNYGTDIPAMAVTCAAYTAADAMVIVRNMSEDERLGYLKDAFDDEGDDND